MPMNVKIDATETEFSHLPPCRGESDSITEHRNMPSIPLVPESFMNAVKLTSSSFSSACYIG